MLELAVLVGLGLEGLDFGVDQGLHRSISSELRVEVLRRGELYGFDLDRSN
jgi:hypothetical protein